MGNLVNQVEAQYKDRIESLEGAVLTQTAVVGTEKTEYDAALKKFNDYKIVLDNFADRIRQQTNPTVIMTMTATLRSMVSSLETLEIIKNNSYNEWQREIVELNGLKEDLRILVSQYTAARAEAIRQEGILAGSTDPEIIALNMEAATESAKIEAAKSLADKESAQQGKIIIGVFIVVIIIAIGYFTTKG